MTSPEPRTPSPRRPLLARFDAYFATILSKAPFADYPYGGPGAALRALALVATALAVLVLVVVVIPPDRDHDQSNPLRDSVVSRVQLWALLKSPTLFWGVVGDEARLEQAVSWYSALLHELGARTERVRLEMG